MAYAYIAGPIRGVPDYVRRFRDAAAVLQQIGVNPINPIENEVPMTQDELHQQIAQAYEQQAVPFWIERDVQLIMNLRPKNGDILITLPGWEKSIGARAEVALAQWLQLPVFSLDEFVNKAGEEFGQFTPLDEPSVGHERSVRAGDPRFHALLKYIGELHDKKQADYGTSGDPFANVRSSRECGVKPWVGALIRLNDKVHRLQQFARKGALSNESAEDSMMDIAVYALIALILYREESE